MSESNQQKGRKGQTHFYSFRKKPKTRHDKCSQTKCKVCLEPIRCDTKDGQLILLNKDFTLHIHQVEDELEKEKTASEKEREKTKKTESEAVRDGREA